VDGPTLLPGSPWHAFTLEQRPDLWDKANELSFDVWPEYNMHGNQTGAYFGELRQRFARFQVLICDQETGEVVGRGRSIPLRWDGTLADLPAGIDAAGLRAVTEEAAPTAVSALAAEVARDRQGQGLSGLVIQAMAAAARAAGLGPLIAPVRPNWKDRYPITRLTVTPPGSGLTASRSTRGCGCTPGSAPPSCAPSPGRWRSSRRSPTGRSGPGCCSPSPARSRSPAAWLR